MRLKGILSTIFLCFFCSILFAQSSYEDAIQKGNNAYQKGAYNEAMNLYFAAEAFDLSKRN